MHGDLVAFACVSVFMCIQKKNNHFSATFSLAFFLFSLVPSLFFVISLSHSPSFLLALYFSIFLFLLLLGIHIYIFFFLKSTSWFGWFVFDYVLYERHASRIWRLSINWKVQINIVLFRCIYIILLLFLSFSLFIVFIWIEWYSTVS